MFYRYGPGVMDPYRVVDEERAKAMYTAHMRAKDPSPIPAPSLRMNPTSLKPSPSENGPTR